MIRQLGYAIILVCGLTGFPSAAQETAPLDADLDGGTVGYVNPAALEITIGRKLFKLDHRFQIHGVSGDDNVQRLRALRQGMGVQYGLSGSSPGYEGVIRELWVQPD